MYGVDRIWGVEEDGTARGIVKPATSRHLELAEAGGRGQTASELRAERSPGSCRRGREGRGEGGEGCVGRRSQDGGLEVEGEDGGQSRDRRERLAPTRQPISGCRQEWPVYFWLLGATST